MSPENKNTLEELEYAHKPLEKRCRVRMDKREILLVSCEEQLNYERDADRTFTQIIA